MQIMIKILPCQHFTNWSRMNRLTHLFRVWQFMPKVLQANQSVHKIIAMVPFVFVAVFLGCTSTGRVGLCFLRFYVQELPKAQPAVVLVLKRLRRRGNGLKSHPTD